MPSHASAQIKPIRTISSPINHQKLGRTYPDFATLALRPGWERAYDWAVKNDILYELLVALNATQLGDHAVALGTLLEHISSDEAFLSLKEWAEHEPAAAPLFRLAQAAIQDSRILSEYSPLTQAVSATSQFDGLLQTHYLIALLTEKPAPIDFADQSWLNMMKLWVLVHAIDRASQGNAQDNWLRQVATKLRLASHRDEKWRRIFLHLRSQAGDFDELSRNIVRRAESLLTKSQTSNLSNGERQLLQAIIKVATKVHSKDTNPEKHLKCQSARKFDHLSASNFDQQNIGFRAAFCAA